MSKQTKQRYYIAKRLQHRIIGLYGRDAISYTILEDTENFYVYPTGIKHYSNLDVQYYSLVIINKFTHKVLRDKLYLYGVGYEFKKITVPSFSRG